VANQKNGTNLLLLKKENQKRVQIEIKKKKFENNLNILFFKNKLLTKRRFFKKYP